MTGPTKLTQLHCNGPEIKPVGDCYRTALACILGYDTPERVPHFVDIELQHRSILQTSLSTIWAREWTRDTTPMDLGMFAPGAIVLAPYVDADTAPLLAVATVPGHAAKWHCVVWDLVRDELWHDPTPEIARRREYVAADVRELETFVMPYEPGPYDGNEFGVTVQIIDDPWNHS